MQVHMLASLHETVQLAPELLQDAFSVHYTCWTKAHSADPAAATCHAPL